MFTLDAFRMTAVTRRLSVTLAAVLLAEITAVPASAQSREAPAAAGLAGKLLIHVEVSGIAQGRPAKRIMDMELNMVSAAASPLHPLQKGADEDMQRDIEHQKEVGEAAQAGRAEFERMKAALVQLDACRQDENSDSCLQGKRSMEESGQRMGRIRADVQAKEANAPAYTSQNRYQSWTTSYKAGCGEINAKILDNAALSREVRLPLNTSDNTRLITCGTQLVIDRRTKKATLRITPIDVAFPADSRHRRQSLIDFDDLDEDSGAESDGRSNAIVIRDQAMNGTEKNFTGIRSYRSIRGFTTTIRWQFMQ